MIYFSLIYVFFTLLVAIYFKKQNYLSNFSGDNHQLFSNKKNIPLVGGILLFIPIILLDFKNFFFILSIISITLIGLLSDKKILTSPQKRFLFQLAFIVIAVTTLNLEIISSRINFFDNLLNINMFNIFFTSFCLLILINGSNFIDGINCNLITYYLLITGIIFLIKGPNINFNLSNIDLYIIISSLIIILIFNLMGKLTSGDGGAYLVSFFWGVNLINFSEDNNFVSPFFVVLILWYPAFENLFSIIRKLKLKKSALNADFKHLHQLIFLLIKTKIKNKNLANNYSGLIISFYNLIIFYLSFKFYHHTQTLIIITIFNIFIYLIIYFRILSVFKIIAKKH